MLRKLLSIIIAMCPFNKARIILYRILLGYRISFDSYIGPFNYIECLYFSMSSARIGYLNIIRVGHCEMSKGSEIRKNNHLTSFNSLSIGRKSSIVSRNNFVGTRSGICPYKNYEDISIGDNSIITVGHYFDISDSITIGGNVTLAGSGVSELWTHGFDLHHVKVQAPVEIGNDCYIGSRSIILHGTKIADNISRRGQGPLSQNLLMNRVSMFHHN